MHDARLDDQVRSALRGAGDAVAFTVTVADLEARLAERRRERAGRRMSVIAAAVALVAVGAIAAAANGWLRLPAAGTTATPAPISSPAPAVVAPASSKPGPSPTPRVANPLGRPSQAVLVTPTGPDPRRPDAFEVTLVDPSTLESTPIATVPGSVIPSDGWVGASGPAKISTTGWLAIPFLHGPSEDEATPAVVILDVRAGTPDPWVIDGVTSMSWDLTDKLVVTRGDMIDVAWAGSRYLEPFGIQTQGVAVAMAGATGAAGPATADQQGARFLATTTDERRSWGFLDFRGGFTTTNDLPPVFQRSGRERPAGAGAHGLSMTCDENLTTTADCSLLETDADHQPVTSWISVDAEERVFDAVWASDGASVWMLLDGGIQEPDPAGTDGMQVVSLSYAVDPMSMVERAHLYVPRDLSGPTILGITGETAPGDGATVAIGDAQGRALLFALPAGGSSGVDGTGWFAGWADEQPDYDPD